MTNRHSMAKALALLSLMLATALLGAAMEAAGVLRYSRSERT